MKPNARTGILSFLYGVAALGAALSTGASARPLDAKGIDALAERALREFDTPGAAVAVVKDGAVVYLKGHGALKIGESAPVETDTVFQIASLTKAFTAASIAILVDEGRLSFDDRVVDHLPQFQMQDEWVTRHFTIRDLLSHRSGLSLGAGDLLWWPHTTASREDVLKAMKVLPPSVEFRDAYRYNNLMFIIAGLVVESASGVSWEDFIETRIMAPLGMTGCRAMPERLPAGAPRATPHVTIEGETMPTLFGSGEPGSAAAAINCTIADLAKWAAFHLNEGASPDGTILITPKTHAMMWSAVTPRSASPLIKAQASGHFRAYGLGWATQDFNGRLHVSHGGVMPGMQSAIALIPEEELGVIVFTNNWRAASDAIATEIIDSYTSKKPKDWVRIYKDLEIEDAAATETERAARLAQKDPSTAPSLALAQYAGLYRDAWYGDLSVEIENDALVLKLSKTPALVGPLEPFNGDVFLVKWRDRSIPADAFVEFSLKDGRVTGFAMRPVSPDIDFSYDFQDLNAQKVAAPNR